MEVYIYICVYISCGECTCMCVHICACVFDLFIHLSIYLFMYLPIHVRVCIRMYRATCTLSKSVELGTRAPIREDLPSVAQHVVAEAPRLKQGLMFRAEQCRSLEGVHMSPSLGPWLLDGDLKCWPLYFF